jgi:hypothetical protein
MARPHQGFFGYQPGFAYCNVLPTGANQKIKWGMNKGAWLPHINEPNSSLILFFKKKKKNTPMPTGSLSGAAHAQAPTVPMAANGKKIPWP